MSTLDLTGSGTLPAGGHRMTDPRIRARAFVLAALLCAASWAAVALLGRPATAGFTEQECRELTGVPIPPECAPARIAPGGPFDRPAP